VEFDNMDSRSTIGRVTFPGQIGYSG
ncbi:uncharacterized protein METZ01_LOCUS221264, partial [marine metagenome]